MSCRIFYVNYKNVRKYISNIRFIVNIDILIKQIRKNVTILFECLTL